MRSVAVKCSRRARATVYTPDMSLTIGIHTTKCSQDVASVDGYTSAPLSECGTHVSREGMATVRGKR